MRVLGFGDNIVDRFTDRGVDYPGGNSVNVAVYARRLGLEAAYLGVFGDDELGRFLGEAIAAQGVALDHCVTRAGETGLSLLRVDDGDRVFLGWNGGGVTVREPLVLDGGLLAYASSFDLVHSSVYSRSESELPKLAGLGTLVSFDLSSEEEFRTPAYLDRICPHADLVLLSCSHLDEAGTRDLLAEAVRRGAAVALATRGVDGAMACDGRVTVTAPARRVADPRGIVDTMGCGDAFLTGFAVSLLRGGWSPDAPPRHRMIEDALRAGADTAYGQCFVEGAFGCGRPAMASMWRASEHER
ncbi:PfkB family carbohydrate kinase [Planomonospora venezuelensis]|uniref:Sugar/nucleoside kinase (Ribokinase family) n=1 Tax=Planomonospora venezuelensis TaxID=1999 RepID=A0A841CX51_PLAVE|nr:PfkB family carbohydrate kinase [Planomonospora venezuelensis]MBB5962491.1 sugar/nucleoside kinase (ribokinase family) [Planomonospora venezuelensis]GIM99107.1 fructosamine kinase FrlD [Planomonospora venezuelensis]